MRSDTELVVVLSWFDRSSFNELVFLVSQVLLTQYRARKTLTNVAFWTQQSLLLASSVYRKHLAWRNWHLKIHKLHEKKPSLFPCRCRAITSQWLPLPSWLTLEMQAIHTIIFSLIVWLWVVIFQPGGTPLTISKTLNTITMASHEALCWSPATFEVAGKR